MKPQVVKVIPTVMLQRMLLAMQFCRPQGWVTWAQCLVLQIQSGLGHRAQIC
jgi:hypothetical protein